MKNKPSKEEEKFPAHPKAEEEDGEEDGDADSGDGDTKICAQCTRLLTACMEEIKSAIICLFRPRLKLENGSEMVKR